MNEGSLSQAEERLVAWVALTRVEGLGAATAKRLAERVGDPRRVWELGERELAASGLEARVIERVRRFSDWRGVREEMARARAAGAEIVAFDDPDYPPRLREIADPPPVLYCLGKLLRRDERAVAIVGSRSASPYGSRMARELSRGLALSGFTVVSGLARGIDAEAHRGALEAGGRTIAVLGSGADVVYPREHRPLWQQIAEAGAVLSELPIGTPPLPRHFPARNRLISGLALGVVVVEATEVSGSLITARMAADQGREVFAVPGQAGASRSRGTHRLIRQGAKLVERVEDILEEIAPQLAGAPAARAARPPAVEVSAEEGRLLELVRLAPLQIDELIDASGFPSAKIAELLLGLELKGLLKQLPGKKFIAS